LADRDHWAVIVAGSNGYWNYRHQADACHAYQVAKSKGIAEDHIIMMAYDDIAHNSENPFPGQLFNKPDGPDVYAGCNIDYRGDDVTPEKFMEVLTGTASGKSLQSTSEDNVFIFFSDHGAPGLIAFPASAGVLHKTDMVNTFQTMSDKGMFNKLTFYLEACESGSMFEDLNIPNVYALSAANPTESSWGAYCGRDAIVNGKNINSCLGDLFSVNWMEDAEAVDTTSESLDTAFKTIMTKTTKSDVMQWGDVSFTDDKVAEFVGTLNPDLITSDTDASASAVNVRQVDLDRLYSMYTSATTSADRLVVGEQFQRELASQMAVDLIHTKFIDLVFAGEPFIQEYVRTHKSPPTERECEVFVHNAFQQYSAAQFDANSGFALQFHQIVVNTCGVFKSRYNGVVTPEKTKELVNAVRVAIEGVVV